MKSRGFTLVELLAVIVILSVIALIATPVILNVVGDAREKTAIESLKGYIEAIEKVVVTSELEDEVLLEEDEDGCYYLESLKSLVETKGNKPTYEADKKVCLSDGFVTKLEEVTINNYKLKYENGKYYINGKMIGTFVADLKEKGFVAKETDDGYELKSYKGTSENVVIPAGITSIGNSAFFDNEPKITSVTIPDSVTTIGNSAFSANELTSIEIPDSVTSIGEYAFSSNQLTTVEIPDSVTTIGNNAFSFNQLKTVKLSNNITIIPRAAFYDNSLESITIPNSVITISSSAFASNDLTTLTIPDNVDYIESKAFYDNKLTSVLISNCVKGIRSQAFASNQLTAVTLSSGVSIIDDSTSSEYPFDPTVNLTRTYESLC